MTGAELTGTPPPRGGRRLGSPEPNLNVDGWGRSAPVTQKWVPTETGERGRCPVRGAPVLNGVVTGVEGSSERR